METKNTTADYLTKPVNKNTDNFKKVIKMEGKLKIDEMLAKRIRL